MMDMPQHALPIAEIVRRYPDQWVLVEETAWDAHAQPTAGIVRATSMSRSELREPLRRCHHDRMVTTFLFYTGDPIPADLTVVCGVDPNSETPPATSLPRPSWMATSRRAGWTVQPPWWRREAAVSLPQVWQWRYMPRV